MAKAKTRAGHPKATKVLPRSARLSRAIEEAARKEFMSRGAWLLKLASQTLGVPDTDSRDNAEALAKPGTGAAA